MILGMIMDIALAIPHTYTPWFLHTLGVSIWVTNPDALITCVALVRLKA